MVSETTIASGVNRYLEMPVRNTIKMVMVVTSTGSATSCAPSKAAQNIFEINKL